MTLIFTHYGFSSYLEYTLKIAQQSNQNSKLIFLGDKSNRAVAHKNYWEHYDINLDSDLSQLHKRFLNCYRDIQGKNHLSHRNGKNWLKYVFERWFYIYDYCLKHEINKFWHFDSDTLILKNLNNYSYLFKKYEFSTQCNNSCLNGIITLPVVNEYCELICELFENLDFTASQQHEFDTVNQDHAFTEMRAFKIYMTKTKRVGLYLGNADNLEIFDDCICQDHGFNVVSLPTGQKIKHITAHSGRIYGSKDGKRIEFITLNFSWVPTYLFKWAQAGIDGDILDVKRIKCSLKDYIKYYLVNIYISFRKFKNSL